MKAAIMSIFPEIGEIKAQELQNNVLDTYVDALKTGGWTPDDMLSIPFTLDFPEFIFSYADHVHGVTGVCREAARVFNQTYSSKSEYHVDEDLVLAGALLHDVGKLLEYEKDEKGNYRKTKLGLSLRHPISGAILASRNGCSPELCHIIAVHAAEGDCGKRSPEGIIINKADFLNFEVIERIRQR